MASRPSAVRFFSGSSRATDGARRRSRRQASDTSTRLDATQPPSHKVAKTPPVTRLPGGETRSIDRWSNGSIVESVSLASECELGDLDNGGPDSVGIPWRFPFHLRQTRGVSLPTFRGVTIRFPGAER